MPSLDQATMQLALNLAQQGRYCVQPNPMVGCIITNPDNKVVAQGYHQDYGKAHAEVNALANFQTNKPQTHKLFVTLEPCCHQGKTPPCVNAIINSGIKTVFIAMLDPNPKVSGKGVKLLKQAGIKVSIGLCKQEAQALNKPFIKAMQTGLPFVVCKIAMSLDGKTAMANGQSKWITSPASRDDAQTLRLASDAILTGSGTVLADNPRLTVRLSECSRPPIRIVLDTQNKIPADFNIFSNDATTHHHTRHNTDLNSDNKIALEPLLRQYHQDGINHILLEAGNTLVGAMLEQHLIDEFVFYTAPLLLGNTAKSAITMPIDNLSDAAKLEIINTQMIGKDLKITAKTILN